MKRKSQFTVQRKPLKALKPHPRNPRTISDKAMAGLQRSLAKYGYVEPIVWNKTTGHIVGGHQRVKALKAQGETEADVAVIEMSPADELGLMVALNNSAITGTWTGELDAILSELKIELADDFDTLAFDELRHEFDALFPPDKEKPKDEPPAKKAPKQVCKPGDLWTAGEHRILCGDSTEQAAVMRLLERREPFIMVTDPPYGVNYDPQWRNESFKAAKRRTGKVTHDDRVGWGAAFNFFTGNVAYIWYATLFETGVLPQLLAHDLEPRSQIIWAKPSMSVSRGHYHWQTEGCIYAVRKGGSAQWCGGRSQSNLWQISNRIPDSTNHGTQKPIECFLRPMQNHGRRGDMVYEPFLGSGTALVAAERAKRVCLAMELEPTYVDMALLRFMEATGTPPVREADGKPFNELLEA